METQTVTAPPPVALTASGLMQKVRDIQNSVGTVKKKGRNTEHNYQFLRIEDAVVAVNKMMSERDLVLMPTLAKRPDGTFYFDRQPHKVDKGYMSTLVLEWKLEDVSTGESRLYNVPGEGYDTTDKGFPKAITSSRKQAIILIFNIPVGNDIEERGGMTVERDTAKGNAQSIAARKIAEAAGKGNKTAIDALSQIEPEKKIIIKRPEEHNGNYIAVFGLIAVPQLEQFFADTGSKSYQTKTVPITRYWRVPSEYEEGLVKMCERLNIEVEG